MGTAELDGGGGVPMLHNSVGFPKSCFAPWEHGSPLGKGGGRERGSVEEHLAPCFQHGEDQGQVSHAAGRVLWSPGRCQQCVSPCWAVRWMIASGLPA